MKLDREMKVKNIRNKAQTAKMKVVYDFLKNLLFLYSYSSFEFKKGQFIGFLCYPSIPKSIVASNK